MNKKQARLLGRAALRGQKKLVYSGLEEGVGG
jgi:hypothetical protein